MYTVSDFVIDRLIAWDLHHYHGYPGDDIGGFYALGRAQKAGKDFRYIRPTHEEMAALMASAHAKFTGEVGVCMATSGPGAVHLMNGLYDAHCDNQPVVAIVGQQARVALGSDFQQELTMERLFEDVAEYVKTVTTPMQAQLVVDRAVRIAQTSRRPCVVIPPADVQDLGLREPGLEHFASPSGVGHASTRIPPPPRSSSAPPTSSTPVRRWRCSSGRAPSARPTRCWRSPTRSAPASSQRCSARRRCPATSRTTPSSSGSSAPSRAGT